VASDVALTYTTSAVTTAQPVILVNGQMMVNMYSMTGLVEGSYTINARVAAAQTWTVTETSKVEWWAPSQHQHNTQSRSQRTVSQTSHRSLLIPCQVHRRCHQVWHPGVVYCQYVRLPDDCQHSGPWQRQQCCHHVI
jgi:hypothetical protein